MQIKEFDQEVYQQVESELLTVMQQLKPKMIQTPTLYNNLSLITGVFQKGKLILISDNLGGLYLSATNSETQLGQ